MTHVFPKETFTFWQFSVGLWGVCPAYFLSKQMAHDAMLLPEVLKARTHVAYQISNGNSQKDNFHKTFY